MNRQSALLIILMLFLVSISYVTLTVHKAEAAGTIYIRADGRLDPPTAPITTVDNVTYTFTDNINDSIVIERSNIIINGNGRTLQGSGSDTAFSWLAINNVTVRNIDIRDFECGFYLASAAFSTVSGNTITNSQIGVRLDWGASNTVSENTIANSSQTGVRLSYGSNSHTFFGNTIANSSNFGIYSEGCSNNTFSANTIRQSGTGVALESGSSSNHLSENTIANSQTGIFLYDASNNNTVSGNMIADNTNVGVSLRSSNNVVSGNTIANSHYGVYLDSSGNEIYHNNFINYTTPAGATTSARWDDGYPSGGNYWSDYSGQDSNHDGIGDSNYTIDANNNDRYPLMGMFHSYNVTWIDSGYIVDLISNSTISAFDVGFGIEHPEDRIITFKVTGTSDTAGFCRICIPTALMHGTYRVFVNGTEILPPPEPLLGSNSTHNYLYFNYPHSTQEVIVVPEFRSFFILPMLMMAMLLAVMVYMKLQQSFSPRRSQTNHVTI